MLQCFLLRQSIPTFDSLGDALISSQTVNTVDDIFDSSLNLENTHRPTTKKATRKAIQMV